MFYNIEKGSRVETVLDFVDRESRERSSPILSNEKNVQRWSRLFWRTSRREWRRLRACLMLNLP